MCFRKRLMQANTTSAPIHPTHRRVASREDPFGLRLQRRKDSLKAQLIDTGSHHQEVLQPKEPKTTPTNSSRHSQLLFQIAPHISTD